MTTQGFPTFFPYWAAREKGFKGKMVWCYANKIDVISDLTGGCLGTNMVAFPLLSG